MARFLAALTLLSLPLLASAYLPVGSVPALALKWKLQPSTHRAGPRFAGVTGLKSASTFGLSAKAGDKDQVVRGRVPEDPTTKCACGKRSFLSLLLECCEHQSASGLCVRAQKLTPML